MNFTELNLMKQNKYGDTASFHKSDGTQSNTGTLLQSNSALDGITQGNNRIFDQSDLLDAEQFSAAVSNFVIQD